MILSDLITHYTKTKLQDLLDLITHYTKTKLQDLSDLITHYTKTKLQELSDLITHYTKTKLQDLSDLITHYTKTKLQDLSDLITHYTNADDDNVRKITPLRCFPNTNRSIYSGQVLGTFLSSMTNKFCFFRRVICFTVRDWMTFSIFRIILPVFCVCIQREMTFSPFRLQVFHVYIQIDGPFPSTTKTLDDAGNLTIVHLSDEDKGTYECIATNVVTSIVTTALLIIVECRYNRVYVS